MDASNVDLTNIDRLREYLLQGHVIPAHPLALTAERKLDESHQRALSRYYFDAGAGGIAVGVHTTQFAIRQQEHNLLRPVLELASRTIDEKISAHPRPFVKIAGICGRSNQAEKEAIVARSLGYHAGLLSLSKWPLAEEYAILAHCEYISGIIPIFGFYLQPAVGGRILSYNFWRGFLDIENIAAIKIAPFNRYQTLDVLRAVADSGRTDVALYTGNDDNIILDLLTDFQFHSDGETIKIKICGGLLGQWAVWTSKAVTMLNEIKSARSKPSLDAAWLTRATQLTDANSALFDAANGYAGCIAGINEVLRRQGLMQNNDCLDPNEALSAGQAEEMDRVIRAYPELIDNEFVSSHLDEWLG